MQYVFELGELFEQVQLQSIYKDNKTFVDCIPRDSLASIRERYEEQKSAPSFKLEEFVHENFDEPGLVSAAFESDRNAAVSDHIRKLWDVLTRMPGDKKNDTLIPLPKSYIVPGGRFREIYYWDSYFTMLGLRLSARVDMVRNMVDNFAYLIDKVGFIPNGNRMYYISRSQPPYFSLMVNLLAEEEGSKVRYEYLPQLEKEYHFWMKGWDNLSADDQSINRLVRLPGDHYLNHYWDDKDSPRPEAYKHEIRVASTASDKKKVYRHLRAACESGWDFSSRWFRDGQTMETIHAGEIIPVDLNCLLLGLEKSLAEAHTAGGDDASAAKYLDLVMKRKEAIQRYYWNDNEGFYFDYDYVGKQQTSSWHLGAAFPLYFNVATPDQAALVAEKIENEFLKSGGLISTLKTTTQQWDAPNGWAPLQWIAVIGLHNYGHTTLAREIATRWMRINESVFKSTGKLMEKYNVVDTGLTAGGGEYTSQDGFGWTNGVYLAMENFMQTTS